MTEFKGTAAAPKKRRSKADKQKIIFLCTIFALPAINFAVFWVYLNISAIDFTVADIKAQLEKQNQTYQNFDSFKSDAYLYTMITLSNPCDIYFYSVEFHKAAANEIDASSAQGVA